MNLRQGFEERGGMFWVRTVRRAFVFTPKVYFSVEAVSVPSFLEGAL